MTTPKQDGPGRPKADIDPKIVAVMVKIGCTVEEIADEFEVNKKTIERRFKKILNSGRLKRNVSLRRKQWEQAMAGDRTMLIWLGKVLLGQSDKIQVVGKDDGPIKHQHELSQMTNEQLDKEIEKLVGPITGAETATDGSDSGEK